MRVAALAIGIALTAWVFLAIVKVMLIPRGTQSWVVSGVTGFVRGLATAPLSLLRTYRLRDAWLAGVAPVSVLLQLVVYVVLLILTLGLVVYGTSDLSMLNSLYQSGATLTTLGIVQPVTVASTIVTFIAAFLGLVVIAIFIGYLMAIYGAYTSREQAMARLALIAGQPSWGPQILARGHVLRLPPEQSPDCEEWVGWITETRMNTQVNPVLSDFRSTNRNRHWVVSMLAVLDATALRISLEGRATPHQVRLIGAGAVAAAVLRESDEVHNWAVEDRVLGIVADSTGSASPDHSQLSPADLEAGWRALREVDYPLPDDLAGAERRFRAIRSVYARDVLALASHLQAVPAPWAGERSPTMPTMWPEIANSSDTHP